MATSKKDYIAIAEICRRSVLGEKERPVAAAIARGLADYFAQSNPQFRRAQFLQACGVQP